MTGSLGTHRHSLAAPTVPAAALQTINLGGLVDGSRIALWGVSYAGGHVLVTAAKFGTDISAVIANVRHCWAGGDLVM